MKKFRLFILFIFVFQSIILAQKASEKEVLTDNVEIDFLNNLVFETLNKQILANGKEIFGADSLLKIVAGHHALYMSLNNDASLIEKGKQKTTAGRLKSLGGSTFASEFVLKVPTKNGKINYTYQQLADEIVFKITSAKKTFELFLKPEFTLIGIASNLDKSGTKLYFSFVLGNYKSYNLGANRVGELTVPYSKKAKGLKAFDEKLCKNCDKFQNIETFQNGLYIDENKIMFKYDNLKTFYKLIKNSKDGLAVDVIQNEQFACIGHNIVDNTKLNKGIVLKKVYKKKLLKNNTIEAKSENKIDVQLGILPKGVDDNYELNLLIIQEKHICKSLAKIYVNDTKFDASNGLGLLADTVTINNEKLYVPKNETSKLSFKIPFEKNKYEYNVSDIDPFLKSLNEPSYDIDILKITAFSSIEGNEQDNQILQKKRAESIVNALTSNQKKNIRTEIITNENWAEFLTDFELTKHYSPEIANLESAREYIRTKNLYSELEPILSKHRYAKIEMMVSYNILGKNEEAFVVSRFNKAIKENNRILALSIQKYIFKQILNKKYSSEAVLKQEIPMEKDLAGLLMNKLWLEKFVKNSPLDVEFANRIEELYKLNSDNDYIAFNYLYSRVIVSEIGDEKQMKELQDKINKMYTRSIPQSTIDALNLEYQFKIIKTLDTTETTHPKVIESLAMIKNIVKLEEASWQNALKLALMFMKQNDNAFALKLLEPFVEKPNFSEDFIFTYISLCTIYPTKMFSHKFEIAMQKAEELNHEKYCDLIKSNKISLQIFENLKVKEYYCKTCK